MYRKTYYATHPGSVEGATNDELRDRYHVAGLFAAIRRANTGTLSEGALAPPVEGGDA